MKISSKVLFVVIQTYGIIALQFFSIMITSRVLTPAQIGVFSIGSILFSVASYLRDFGIGSYVTNAQQMDEAALRSAAGLNLLTTFSAAALLWLSAPFVEDFYKVAGVTDVIRILALSCLVIGFGTIPMAFHRRQLNIIPQFWVGVMQPLTSTVVTIYFAFKGLGYYALAYGHLAGMSAATITAMLLRPKDFPVRPAFNHFRPAISFGSKLVWINVIDRLGKGLPELAIAKSVGVESSALFSRGDGLIGLFRNGLESITNSVTAPYYAQQHRDGLSLRQAFMQTLSFSLATGWAFVAVLGVMAPAVLTILFGHQWTGAADYLRVLCVVFAVELLSQPVKDVLLASGNVAVAAKRQTAIHAIRIALVFATLSFGGLAVAMSLVASALCGVGLTYWILHGKIGLTLSDVYKAVRLPLIICMVTALASWLVQTLTTGWSQWASFGTGALVTTIVWLSAIFLVQHPLAGIIAGFYAKARLLIMRQH